MKASKPIDILLNVMLPIGVGCLIYAAAGFPLPSIVRNYLPDGLWAYALMSSILIVWDRSIHFLWVVLAILSGIAYEWLQYRHILAGTGDAGDIAAYTVFGLLALLFNPYFKSRTIPKP